MDPERSCSERGRVFIRCCVSDHPEAASRLLFHDIFRDVQKLGCFSLRRAQDASLDENIPATFRHIIYRPLQSLPFVTPKQHMLLRWPVVLNSFQNATIEFEGVSVSNLRLSNAFSDDVLHYDEEIRPTTTYFSKTIHRIHSGVCFLNEIVDIAGVTLLST